MRERERENRALEHVRLVVMQYIFHAYTSLVVFSLLVTLPPVARASKTLFQHWVAHFPGRRNILQFIPDILARKASMGTFQRPLIGRSKSLLGSSRNGITRSLALVQGS